LDQAATGAGSAAAAVPAPGFTPPAAAYVQATSQFQYAGFWRRFVAMIIDGLIFSPLFVIFFALSGLGGGLLGAIAGGDHDPSGFGAAMLALGIGVGVLVLFLGSWLYHTMMEASRHQATLGKMVLGIKVTDLKGNRISFARANGRFFGKCVSGAIMNIGYLMAAFTEKKQALHDMLAGCLVILK
jgi:uncharacterized RDD family membrane protein YckC